MPHLLPLLLATLLPSPSSCLAIGWGAGVTSQVWPLISWSYNGPHHDGQTCPRSGRPWLLLQRLTPSGSPTLVGALHLPPELPPGTDCAAAAATAALQPGWPGAQVPGAPLPRPPGVWSQHSGARSPQHLPEEEGPAPRWQVGSLPPILPRWSPWRQVAGTVGAAWRPDWGSIGGVRPT